MRKLTGYIGAMVIVIALMGSILAGYALNINGTSTVMNEYEKVTDVSGLYTHTQEPAYIDYNPASNYIGYSSEQIINADSNRCFKNLNSGNIIINKNGNSMTIDGRGITNIGTYQSIIICDRYFIQVNGNNNGLFLFGEWGLYITPTTNVTIQINGNTNTIAFNGSTYTYNNISKNIVYWGTQTNKLDDTYDYNFVNGAGSGYTGVVNAYFNNLNDVYAFGYINPALSNGDSRYISVGNKIYYPVNHSSPNFTSTMINATVISGYDDLLTANVNYPEYSKTGDWDNNGNSTTKTIAPYYIFYPRIINTSSIGINYTESNRVNNYPIETEYSIISGTYAGALDLMTLSAADQSVGTWILDRSGGSYNSGSVDAYWMADNYISYKLSDIIPTLNPPADTKIIRFQYNIHGTVHNYYYYDVNGDSSKRVGMSYYVPYNPVTLTLKSWVSAPGINKPTTWTNGYVDYNTDTGLCDYYNSDGVKIGTNTPSELCISFIPNNISTSTAKIFVTGQYNYEDSVTYPLSIPQTPTVNIIYTTSGTITDIHYSDITKGYSIKSTNITNTIWNNEYNNGKIQLLFRSESTPGYYHNDILIGTNSISIDYEQNKYLVSLNGADPVNIGTWRNIVLDIDLISGELSAIPVRTFNNYTNVVMDNTNVFIGDLVSPTAINVIEWAPTPNSLMFNIYNTSVFMDTYGVVMVDPILDITDYFTDLENFYQLRLSNFSMYGQSMTVNGVTGNVTGNTIKFNDETIQIKDMEITYADGNAYISDSYATIDLGAITDNTVSMTGAWYFTTDLYDGYTTQKMVYDWDWGEFILEDKAFGVIYIGLCLVGLIVARHFCTLTITDYLLFVVSIVIALTVPVIV